MHFFRDRETVLFKGVDIRVWGQLGFLIVYKSQKFFVHFWVLEVRIGVFGPHGILLENGLTIFNLFDGLVAIQDFIAKLLVTFGQVLLANISLEDRFTNDNFAGVIFEFGLFYLNHRRFVFKKPVSNFVGVFFAV